MKTFKSLETTFVYNNDGTWSITPPNAEMRRVLDDHVEWILENMSPAHGDPRTIIFYSIVDLFSGTSIVDDELVEDVPPDSAKIP